VKFGPSRWLIAVLAALPLLCAYSCAVPLGPGYHIEKESVELSFSAQPQPRLHLHARFSLENIGNAPLTVLDVTVPEKDFVGRDNLRITVDGKDAQVTESLPAGATMATTNVSFEPAWSPHQKKEIEITCDMTRGSNGRTSIAPNALAFDGAYWFPTFDAPKRLFAKGEQRADPTDLSVVLPKDFLAVASGRQTGRKARGETVEYRFRLRDADNAPYVVAGRYKQQLAKTKGTSVYFWTFQGLPDNAVKSAGEQIAAATRFFDSNFVARARGESPVWAVELPESEASSTSFPNVILLDNKQLSSTIANGQISPDEIGLLADTWLQWIASPEPREGIMPISLRTYAADAFYESQDGGASYRQKKIAEYLGQYDAARAHAAEKPVVQMTLGENPDQVNMAVNKAGLFLYALEDACGSTAFRHGVGQMISDLRGREYGYADLRATLNSECSRFNGHTADIDALFRVWLYESGGIPADFRERYAATSGLQDTK
jgi:hypothetical protein